MGALHDAVQSGDRRTALVQLRNSLAETIDDTESGRDIAALSKRLMEVMSEIESLPDPSAEKSAIQRERARVRGRSRDG